MMVENAYMLHATYAAPAVPTHALPLLPQALSTWGGTNMPKWCGGS